MAWNTSWNPIVDISKPFTKEKRTLELESLRIVELFTKGGGSNTYISSFTGLTADGLSGTYWGSDSNFILSTVAGLGNFGYYSTIPMSSFSVRSLSTNFILASTVNIPFASLIDNSWKGFDSVTNGRVPATRTSLFTDGTISTHSMVVYGSNTLAVQGNFVLEDVTTKKLSVLSLVSNNFVVDDSGPLFLKDSNILPSTINCLGSYTYLSTTGLQNLTVASGVVNVTILTNTVVNNTVENGYIDTSVNQSTVKNLIFTAGLLKDIDITSTTHGLATMEYISSFQLGSTVKGILETPPYVTPDDLASTVTGLGTFAYISSLDLENIFILGSNYSNYPQYSDLTSTIEGLNFNYVGPLDVVSTFFSDISNNSYNKLDLASTVEGLATIDYISSFDLRSTTIDILSNAIRVRPDITSTVRALGSEGYVSTTNMRDTLGSIKRLLINTFNAPSTLAGLGTASYISTLSLQSTVNNIMKSNVFYSNNLTSTLLGLNINTARYISTSWLVSTVDFYAKITGVTTGQLVTTIDNLAFTQRYVSSTQLESTTTFFINSLAYPSTLENTIDNLGFNRSYISSLDLASTFTDISNNLILIPSLPSTVINLGLADYVSSFDLTSTIYDIRSNIVTRANIASTVRGLGTADYISTLSLQSTITSFNGTPNLFLKNNLTSTVRGLNINPARYISTTWLASTVDFYAKISGVTTGQLDSILDNLAFNQRYVSSGHLESTTTFFIDSLAYPSTLENTIDNLGFNRSYISSLDLASTFTDISNNLILIPSLPSTVINLGLADYVSSFDLTSTIYDIRSNIVTRANIASTVRGLGTADYISTLSLQSTITSFNGTPNLFLKNNLTSTVRGLNINPARYISTTWLASTVNYFASISGVTTGQLDTTVDNLAFNQRYVSSTQLESTTTFFIDSLAYPSTLENTIDNLGFNRSYISSLDLASTFTDISNNLILIPSLPSTVINLGLADYVSSFDLTSTIYDIRSNIVTRANIASTVRGLGTADYISTLSLQSTINSFNGTPNLVVKTNLTSTVRGLGTRNYTSSLDLASNVNIIVNNPNTLSPINFFSAMTHLGSSRYISSQSYLSTFDFLYMNLVRDSNVESTLIGLGTRGYISSLNLASTVDFISLNYPQKTDLASTQQGLGTFVYISSLDLASTVRSLQTTGLAVQSDLISTVRGVGTADYISSLHMASTFRNLSNNYILVRSNTSTVIGIGSANYISSVSLASTNNFISLNYPQNIRLTSTQQGLTTFGYISSLDLGSTMNFISRNYPQNTNLASTLDGLTTFGYISSLDLAQQLGDILPNLLVQSDLSSTIAGLGSARYISSLDLMSTASNIMYNYNLPTNGYVTTSNVISSINYLGSRSYVSTLSMQSTILNIVTRNATFVTNNTVTSTINGLSNRYIKYGPIISNVDLISTTGANFSSVAGVLGSVYDASNIFEFNNAASNSRNPNMVINDITTAPSARPFVIVVGGNANIGPKTNLRYSTDNGLNFTNCILPIDNGGVYYANPFQGVVFNGKMFISIGFKSSVAWPMFSLDGITFTFSQSNTAWSNFTQGNAFINIALTYNPITDIVTAVPAFAKGSVENSYSIFQQGGTRNTLGYYMTNDISRWTRISMTDPPPLLNNGPDTSAKNTSNNHFFLSGYAFNGVFQAFVFTNATSNDKSYLYVSYDGAYLSNINTSARLDITGLAQTYSAPTTVLTVGTFIYYMLVNYTPSGIAGTTGNLFNSQYFYYRSMNGQNWEEVSPSSGSGASGYSNFFYNTMIAPMTVTSATVSGGSGLNFPITNHIQQTPFGYNIPMGYTPIQNTNAGGPNLLNQFLYISPTQNLDLYGNRLIIYKPQNLPLNVSDRWTVIQPSIFYINNTYFIISFGSWALNATQTGNYFYRTTNFVNFDGPGLNVFGPEGNSVYPAINQFATNYDTLAVSLQASNLSIYARNMAARLPSLTYNSSNPSRFEYTNNYIHATNINVSSILNFNDAVFVHGTRNSVTIGGVLAILSSIYLTPTSNMGVNSNTNPYGYFSTFHTLEVNQVIRTTNNMPLKPTPGDWFGYSDENVKTNIVTADLERCYQITSTINLLHYRYISSLETNFTTPDTHMLGYIAQDVAQVFPKSVKPYLFNSTSILSLDITQIQMAQYGATQYMISSIQQRSTLLESQFLEIQTLSGNYSTLISLYNM